jgi:hypothetical protein
LGVVAKARRLLIGAAMRRGDDRNGFGRRKRPWPRTGCSCSAPILLGARRTRSPMRAIAIACSPPAMSRPCAIPLSPRGSPAPCQPEDERNRPQGRRRWVPRQVPARSRQVCLASPSALEAKRAGFARPICRELQPCLAGERGEKEIGARIRANASFRGPAKPALSDYRAGTMPRSQRQAPLVPVSSRRPRCGSLLSATRHAPIVGRLQRGSPRVQSRAGRVPLGG